MSEHVAIYGGSFDPITNGHLDVLRGTLSIFDRAVVAIGTHPGKKGLFDFGERERLIRQVIEDEGIKASAVEIISFDGLLVDAARKCGVKAIVRGLRDGTDLDYEMQMAGMNEMMAPELQTVFLPASPSVRTITATLVRQIASMGGDTTSFVPAAVQRALTNKFD
ncbi:pantetheine-phosphate adenylyltransferase [Oricola cellulosilytica]|uniref:Phosphopantetheine adenylyltransferase n=1 Tax=Oricola cellulosilytica TaxID=1429082 RepID=A0A4R0PB53_9HYPH|nr:pantetheine-phosphate adenylyltransferase [Oricola cellulosilytica]TCD13124.1 pantetheine-phosphate adenylyltransferase [Oricola cellulosilytica]